MFTSSAILPLKVVCLLPNRTLATLHHLLDQLSPLLITEGFSTVWGRDLPNLLTPDAMYGVPTPSVERIIFRSFSTRSPTAVVESFAYALEYR